MSIRSWERSWLVLGTSEPSNSTVDLSALYWLLVRNEGRGLGRGIAHLVKHLSWDLSSTTRSRILNVKAWWHIPAMGRPRQVDLDGSTASCQVPGQWETPTSKKEKKTWVCLEKHYTHIHTLTMRASCLDSYTGWVALLSSSTLTKADHLWTDTSAPRATCQPSLTKGRFEVWGCGTLKTCGWVSQT